MYVCTYIYVYVCMYVCMYVCIYIYTHISGCLQPRRRWNAGNMSDEGETCGSAPNTTNNNSNNKIIIKMITIIIINKHIYIYIYIYNLFTKLTHSPRLRMSAQTAIDSDH